MLNGYSAQIARRKAPPAAENTEASSGALMPKAAVMVIANNSRRMPLNRAVIRVCHPSTSRIPKRVSAQVEIIASVGISVLGKNQLSSPVYVTNLEKLPQATCGAPNGPHSPNRSATAERKLKPRAKRRNREAAARRVVERYAGFSRNSGIRVTRYDSPMRDWGATIQRAEEGKMKAARVLHFGPGEGRSCHHGRAHPKGRLPPL